MNERLEYFRVTMIGTKKVGGDGEVLVHGQLPKAKEVLLGLEASVAPHVQVFDLGPQSQTLLLKNLCRFGPRAGGEIMVVGLHRKEVDEKGTLVALDEDSQVAHL